MNAYPTVTGLAKTNSLLRNGSTFVDPHSSASVVTDLDVYFYLRHKIRSFKFTVQNPYAARARAVKAKVKSPAKILKKICVGNMEAILLNGRVKD